MSALFFAIGMCVVTYILAGSSGLIVAAMAPGGTRKPRGTESGRRAVQESTTRDIIGRH